MQRNWVASLDNPTTTQSVERNRTNEVNQQSVILEQITIKKIVKEILRDTDQQVLETKYTLNLGQLLQTIPNIKCYILTYYHQNLLYQNQQLHQLPLIIKWQ